MERVFVFGSNSAGRHGKGAALFARKERGAIYGQGVGYQGNSYAIPTKNNDLIVLPLLIIQKYVREFIAFAQSRPDLRFQLTPIGCGLAGYKYSDIAWMFKEAPSNVDMPPEFANILEGQAT